MHAALLIRVCILGPFVEQHHGVCKLGIIVPFGSAVFIGIPTIERPTIDRLLLLGGTPAARALGTRNLNICALELALASEDDVCESVLLLAVTVELSTVTINVSVKPERQWSEV